MSKLIAKVVVGSRLHETATPESDWDYRGILVGFLIACIWSVGIRGLE